MRQAAAPGYLLLCLLLGGSAQGIWSNALLQLIGLGIITWAAAQATDEPLTRPAKTLVWILVAALTVIAFQLIPLPASIWPNLGGRQPFAEGFEVLGMAVPARPLSLQPYQSASTLLSLIPAVAIFAAMVRSRAYRAPWLVVVLSGGAIAGVMLGALQLASPDPRTSPWYLYRQSSFGLAPGFFANVNNMAMLLLVCLPFLAAALASAQRKSMQRYSTMAVLLAVAALVMVVGIMLTGSLAGLGLLLPVLAGSALLLIKRPAARRMVAVAAGLLLAVAVFALALSPAGAGLTMTSVPAESRPVIMSTTAEAAKDFLPFGSGLGTFRKVYQLYEDHDGITLTHVNHAHNDYLELILELGIPGSVLMLLFVGWWARAVWRVWRYADASPYARAATIASAVLLAHTLVEFPLRTAALSACFAMCLALMVERRVPKTGRADLRPTRHVELR